jgi:type II secretory pathway pseudopilin PulG
MARATRPDLIADAGFSITELLVAMALMTLIMGTTMAGLADVMKGNELVMTVSQMNASLRAGTDLMIRDMLQAGSGLPSSHTVNIPNGGGSTPVRLPGPPGTAFTTVAEELPAVITYNARGPVINGVQTDVVSLLMSDNSFMDVGVTATGTTFVRVAAGPNLGAGADRLVNGQLMMISKGSFNTLVQLTTFDVATRRLNFANNDSLNLNKSGAANGNLPALNAEDPVNDATAMRISRVRLITYYLDNTTTPGRPRMVRRVNQGHPTLFSNTANGTAVAPEVYDLQFTYDINNGAGNPGGVEMAVADFGVGGRCAPAACAETQIRKINTRITTRSANQNSVATRFLSNTLESQVSLRAMAFVDRYR